MSGRPSAQAGYSMVEVALVTVLVLAGLAALGSVVGGTENLSQDTRLHTRAASEHRRNLRALTNLLRGAEVTTLRGFDSQGVATGIEFQRVRGVGLNDLDYEEPLRIAWVPTDEQVWDVAAPGRVVVVDSRGTQTVAERVPEGGFVVRQLGSTLSIRLTTYYSLGPRRTFQTTTETAVSLRN